MFIHSCCCSCCCCSCCCCSCCRFSCCFVYVFAVKNIYLQYIFSTHRPKNQNVLFFFAVEKCRLSKTPKFQNIIIKLLNVFIWMLLLLSCTPTRLPICMISAICTAVLLFLFCVSGKVL